ncbi:MAG TPA: hypothetical protein VNI57_15245, partial [Candidatus Saccharimonadales bacterium]|nr:hypothetical protein [Candidatus Saccharimonadales bacterium]
PSLPFIQAEKVTDVPIAVRLDPSYGYRLVGRETLDGHPVYVIDFDPVRSGDALYSGRVWIDAESFVRRKIRLVQQGLKAPITSNEDVIDYGPAPGGGEDHWVPLHAYRQMVFTVLGRTVAVERTVSYGDFHVNGPDFEVHRKMAYSSGNRIARDDNNGFAYLTGEPGGVRTQETSSLRNVAIVSGVTLGFSPAVSSPGAGINYFDFDWRGTGTQVDIAWAGPFLDGTWTNPSLGGSRWELSTEGRFLGVRQKLKRTTDNGGRGEEALAVLDEATFFTLAHPLGERMKAELQLQLSRDEFNPADTASRRLVVPADLITETTLGRWRYNRAGVSVELWGSYSHRPNWADWGLPPGPRGQPAGSRGQAGDTTYKRWGTTLAKSWYPGGLQKVGLSVSLDAGSGMDRFSRFRVGDFQSVRVHGFNGSDITFDRGASAELAYQFTIPQTGMSLLVNLDGALMENKEDFLSKPSDRSYREYIVGAGLGVAFNGPWGTLVNVSTGWRVANSLTLDATGTSFHIVLVKTFGDWPWKKNPVEGGTMPGGVGSGTTDLPGDSGSGR